MRSLAGGISELPRESTRRWGVSIDIREVKGCKGQTLMYVYIILYSILRRMAVLCSPKTSGGSAAEELEMHGGRRP